MATLPLPRHALAGGPAGGFPGRGWRMSRPAIVVSVLAHLAVLIVASRWYEDAAVPIETRFEWLTVFEPPAPLAEPTAEVVEPPAPAVAPAPRAVPRAVQPPVVVQRPPEPAVEPPPTPVAPSRLDLEAARREAGAAVVEQHAREGKVREALIDDAPRPWPLTPAPKQPSIFEYHAPSAPRGILQPGKQRSVLGQRVSLWCAKNIGPFTFFGIPACVSQGIRPPSGIMADSIPEYMKLKPECEEAEPLAATLGEASPYPTNKCRLVPKDPDE